MTSIVVNQTGPGTSGWVKFSDDNPDCPVITKAMVIGPPPPALSVVKNHLVLDIRVYIFKCLHFYNADNYRFSSLLGY